MKKGLPRIIIGCILIVFQLLSVIGNSLTGNHLGISFTNVYVFIYDLIGLLTYYFLGILGVIFLVSGLVAYNRKDKAPKEKAKNAPRSFFDDTTSSSTNQETYEVRTTSTPVQHSSQEELRSTAAIKHSNHKYCSRCGSPIDSKSKKCTGCGKQFFSIARFKNHILCILSILIFVAFLLSVKNNLALQQTIKEKNTIIEQLSKENDELLSQHMEEVEKLELEAKIQHSKGYSTGKEEGYAEGYRKGQLDGPTEKQQKLQNNFEETLEELDKEYGITN